MRIGDKVGFKVDYANGGDQVTGTVEDIYEYISNRNIVIVKDAKKNLYKVREEDVIVFEEEPEEEKRDPGEDMITISRKDFQVMCVEVTNPCNYYSAKADIALSIDLCGMLVCRRLEKALFDGGDRG